METLKKLIPAIAILGTGLSIYALIELSKTKKTLHNSLILQNAMAKVTNYKIKSLDNDLTDAEVKDLEDTVKVLESLQKSVKTNG